MSSNHNPGSFNVWRPSASGLLRLMPPSKRSPHRLDRQLALVVKKHVYGGCPDCRRLRGFPPHRALIIPHTYPVMFPC